MRKILSVAAWISALLLFSGLHCMGPLAAKGSSSETVIGRVVNADGSPACSTVVTLYPADFNPIRDAGVVRRRSDTTDATGGYQLNASGPTENYSIVAAKLKSATRALISGIILAGDTTRPHDAVLSAPGVIIAAAPENADVVNGYLYIPGTGIAAFFGDDRKALLDSVPAGIIASINYSSSASAAASRVVAAGVEVAPNDTTVLPFLQWRYYKKLRLNTTVSGAGISGDVVDFPVLVRLTAGNFDFGQAKPDGADIRFAKENGVELPYETERWDAGNKRAEIWVKVDTVRGNDSGQSITMYWGNQGASDNSKGGAVFDPAAGFAGVWHLGETGDSAHDATGNGFNGMNSGAAPAAGMIGNAGNFTNGDYIKIPGLLKTPAGMTLSAWVRTDTSRGGQEVVSLGDCALLRLDDSYGIGTSGWYHNSTVIDTSFAIAKSGRYLANTGWHFVAYAIDAARNVQTVYIDGAQSAVSNDANPVNYKGLGTDTYIGKHGNGKTFFFVGQIDEVRVSRIPLDSNWVRLCYMNQKEQDVLVKY